VRGRIACCAALILVAGCGGSGPKTDADAVAQTLKDAAAAVAGSNGDKACGYLTPDAQRQAALRGDWKITGFQNAVGLPGS